MKLFRFLHAISTYCHMSIERSGAYGFEILKPALCVNVYCIFCVLALESHIKMFSNSNAVYH